MPCSGVPPEIAVDRKNRDHLHRRRRQRHRRVGHAWKRANGVTRAVVERQALRRLDRGAVRVHGRDQHPIAVEPERTCRERRERPNEEARARRRAPARARPARRRGCSAAPPRRPVRRTVPRALILHRLHRRDARGLQRRRHAEEQRGRHRHADREQQHVPVHRHIQEDRPRLGRDLADEEAAAPRRQQDAARRARAGQHHAFREQLPHQAPARRAKRDAQAQLVPPRGGARKEEVRDVGAGDHQHQRNDGHDDDQRTLVALAQRRIAGRRRHERKRPRAVFGMRARRPLHGNRRVEHLLTDAAHGRGRRVERLIRLGAAP